MLPHHLPVHPVVVTLAEGASTLAPLMMVGGVALLGFVLMMSVRRKLIERRRPPASARERVAEVRRAARDRSAVNDVHAAGVEVLDVVRRLAAATENRTQMLEQMIAAADDRIERLEEALATPPASNGTSASSSAPVPAPTRAPTASPPSAPADAHAPRATGAPSLPLRAPVPEVPDLDPLTKSVYRLADAGHGSVEIARELDEQVGKVELILALREPKRSRA